MKENRWDSRLINHLINFQKNQILINYMIVFSEIYLLQNKRHYNSIWEFLIKE